MDVPHFVYPWISWWAFSLFSYVVAAVNIYVKALGGRVFISLDIDLGVELLDYMVTLCLEFEELSLFSRVDIVSVFLSFIVKDTKFVFQHSQHSIFWPFSSVTGLSSPCLGTYCSFCLPWSIPTLRKKYFNTLFDLKCAWSGIMWNLSQSYLYFKVGGGSKSKECWNFRCQVLEEEDLCQKRSAIFWKAIWYDRTWSLRQTNLDSNPHLCNVCKLI